MPRPPLARSHSPPPLRPPRRLRRARGPGIRNRAVLPLDLARSRGEGVGATGVAGRIEIAAGDDDGGEDGGEQDEDRHARNPLDTRDLGADELRFRRAGGRGFCLNRHRPDYAK